MLVDVFGNPAEVVEPEPVGGFLIDYDQIARRWNVIYRRDERYCAMACEHDAINKVKKLCKERVHG